MKKCPYCAEWIQDEAIKCRYCFSDLTGAAAPSVKPPTASAGEPPTTTAGEPSAGAAGEPEAAATGQPPAGTDSQPAAVQPAVVQPASGQPPGPAGGPRPGEGALRFSHSGFRYVLGYGADFFGIWERDRPGGAAERFPRTDQGWVQAWTRFRQLEPRAVEVAPPSSGASPSPGPPTGGAGPASTSPGWTPPGAGGGVTPAVFTEPGSAAAAGPQIGEGALRFSHSGIRYILGYGPDFFGIWDRQAPGGPAMRFPRTDQGWTEAWNRFTAWEPRAVEVPQATPAPDVRTSFSGRYRSGHTLALWVVGLISLSMVLSLVAVLVWGVHLGNIGGFERGSKSLQDLQDSRDASLTAEGWMVFVIAAAAIVWLVWQHRAHSNLRALGAGELKYSPGWAVGWWFIPVANIVMPFLTMRELWKASDPEAGSIEWIGRRATILLGLWWGGRLVTQVSFQIGAILNNNIKSVSDLRSESWFFIAGNALLIATGVLASLLVRSVDARQERKHERVFEWTRSFAPTG